MEKDTATLTDLTRTLEADNATVRPMVKNRQQLGASPEDAALDELRERFGGGDKR